MLNDYIDVTFLQFKFVQDRRKINGTMSIDTWNVNKFCTAVELIFNEMLDFAVNVLENLDLFLN